MAKQDKICFLCTSLSTTTKMSNFLKKDEVSVFSRMLNLHTGNRFLCSCKPLSLYISVWVHSWAPRAVVFNNQQIWIYFIS